jgi:hypothetical protein
MMIVSDQTLCLGLISITVAGVVLEVGGTGLVSQGPTNLEWKTLEKA